ncbi:HAD family hydrolase [Bacillus kexueae]|uniref:HAD family hydrolase n=1 Tax=Aeribacillus kexueae TaxID=2078952 RepID=UPI001FB041F1|nr:HAD family hydrolase [Bacillus kexueae]
MISAIIFDFDGLIFDTETHEYETLVELYEQHGAELPLSVWGEVIGTNSGFCPYQYLKRQVDVEMTKEQFDHAVRERFEERLANETIRPGVAEYIQTAKEIGLKVGLASSSNYEWVSTHLRKLGLLDSFDFISTSDHVEQVKPDPALYLRTAKGLGVDPKECIAFEDSVNGALAAKRAGMYCVIVPNKVTKLLTFGEVDHRLPSMAEMELQSLIETLIPEKA